MPLPTAFIFASKRATRNSILPRLPVSFRGCSRTTSARCPMISSSRVLFAACAVAGFLVAGGCRYLKQDMANQPKNLPLSPSDFFEDGRSERPLLDNTVARGSLADDGLFVPKDSNAFPLPVNQELLQRGRQRVDRHARHETSAQLSPGPSPPGAQRLLLRQHHQRFWRHVRLFCADSPS